MGWWWSCPFILHPSTTGSNLLQTLSSLSQIGGQEHNCHSPNLILRRGCGWLFNRIFSQTSTHAPGIKKRRSCQRCSQSQPYKSVKRMYFTSFVHSWQAHREVQTASNLNCFWRWYSPVRWVSVCSHPSHHSQTFSWRGSVTPNITSNITASFTVDVSLP